MNNNNTRTDDCALSDLELDAASGGRKEVTFAEYEKILAHMIQDSKKGGSSTGGGASGSW